MQTDTPENELPVCTDCLFVYHGKCTHRVILRKQDLVAGVEHTEYSSCWKDRSHGYIVCRLLGSCGKEGRFFRKAIKITEIQEPRGINYEEIYPYEDL
jgi:hypothetical protein